MIDLEVFYRDRFKAAMQLSRYHYSESRFFAAFASKIELKNKAAFEKTASEHQRIAALHYEDASMVRDALAVLIERRRRYAEKNALFASRYSLTGPGFARRVRRL